MYSFLLYAHSWNRWIVLISSLVVVIHALSGIVNKSPYTSTSRRLSLVFVSSLHLQLVLGLALYFLYSPVIQVALADFGAAMKDSVLRFWAVEHLSTGLIAAITATVGSALSKKAATDLEKHKKMAIYFGVSLILILLNIPWVGETVRPLFRF